MFITFERIKELAKKQGLSINSLEEKMGYSRNTIYALKRNKPGSEKLQEIADYFHVSTDYLLGRTDNPAIANGTTGQKTIDFKEIAAQSMSYDGKPLTDDDIDLIAAVLEQRFKNRD
ncbi:helix-turn-helix domain-containing protein [Streptococcus dysgalactiae]|uniref:helix-turn-helix domain-containing protein n=1 Tax=Streptococcus dysgalactiae TaxID=1334 RepID=UPI001CF25B95|nr:helix-turn-helix transcriptional regulator [Streptococcus dysgalactiae]MCB2830320.1 helix-turn-helix domain-containing protein [Streptococcus dysgalactiae subsp. dysgalactiae]MCB2843783.1 helix-turn-helix domain-containing protein [Streptococcus dysgalactiae subsp. dysgalactiae]MCB2847677.1 helix-turn-helix domain-containing protein [Streptococcus dysgalactiae subsp. dysgalactiae]MCB2849478.1 helix-turn-helix domain-containing protein [Streptococcus dysgalactiae subsp. dysgalactiae]MCB28513